MLVLHYEINVKST